MGGMDNLDYADRSSLSGTESCHYAAMVLFQDATVTKPLLKPPVSSTGLNHTQALLKTKLPCHEVPAYAKPAYRPALPLDMILLSERNELTLLDSKKARNVAQKREFLINLVRLGGFEENCTQTWAAVHALASSAVVPMVCSISTTAHN